MSVPHITDSTIPPDICQGGGAGLKGGSKKENVIFRKLFKNLEHNYYIFGSGY